MLQDSVSNNLSPCTATEIDTVEKKDLLFSLANLLSLNRFLGNIPLTALFRTSPPPHFSNILSIVMLFKLPGRVVCV